MKYWLNSNKSTQSTTGFSPTFVSRVGDFARALTVLGVMGSASMLSACGGDGTNTVSVPSVVSDTVAQATSALQGVGLTLGTQTTASNATVPSGEIISESPAANTSVAKGSAVAVVTSGGPPISSMMISGTVAAGTALTGTVSVYDSSASTQPRSSGTAIVTGGQYTVTVTGFTAPFLIQATGQVGGQGPTVTLYSVATAAGTVNVTPITTLMALNMAAGNLQSLMTGSAGALPSLTATDLSDQNTNVDTLLSSVLTAEGLSATYNFSTTAFTPGSAGYDKLLDNVAINSTSATAVTVTNVTAPAAPITINTANGSPSGALDITNGPATLPSEPSVPSVVSDTVTQATSALKSAGLTLGTQTTASSATVPSGEIISQSPAANTSVANGTAVTVVVSSGASETVLHSFAGGSDGATPYAALIQGSDGNFYGTTELGGSNSSCSASISLHGCGTVFKVTPAGVETVLYSFAGGSDGANPHAGLIQGSDGDFYGTTGHGGVNSSCSASQYASGCGTVFKVTPAGVETVLYSFAGGSDGSDPDAALIQGSDGNFYGTTGYGGSNSSCTGTVLVGCGTVFKVTPAGVETVLHSFTGGGDGGVPDGLIQGSDGNFYGTTADGGSNSICSASVSVYGCGTVFKVTPAGVETVLYSFTGVGDGIGPTGLIQGSDGNFYGTTSDGGSSLISNGAVFKVTPAGVETVLYSFFANDGADPGAALIQGSDGNFYGTTELGGSTGVGTLFKITPAGVETMLYSFTGGGDGGVPNGLIQGSDGNLYGTTEIGGANSSCSASAYSGGCGTVFKY